MLIYRNTFLFCFPISQICQSLLTEDQEVRNKFLMHQGDSSFPLSLTTEFDKNILMWLTVVNHHSDSAADTGLTKIISSSFIP